MVFSRRELLPGVMLTALRTERFKTGTLSVSLLCALEEESAGMNALIPSVLRRGTATSPDMDSLAARLDSLYGLAAEPMVRKLGEIQAVGLILSFADGRFLPPDGGDMTAEACDLLGELLCRPATRGGLLLPEYVNSERDKLCERIRARRNNKDAWAAQRLVENMCCFEAYATDKLGSEESVRDINYKKLTKRYRELLSTAPVELFYCGSAEADAVADDLRHALAGLVRGEIDYDLGTDIRMNSVEEGARETVEEDDVSQGKLAIGWRLGECMEEPDVAAIRVFSAVYGGGVTSKLFMNVRERLQLCYYAYSYADIHKGLLIAQSGVAFENYEAARDELFAQLEAVRRGEVTAEELENAKRGVMTDLRMDSDSALALESYWLSQNVDGDGASPTERAELVSEVTLEDVVAVARSLECDCVYFLRGGEGEDDE